MMFIKTFLKEWAIVPLFFLLGLFLGHLVSLHFQARSEPLTPQVDTLYHYSLKVAEIGSFSQNTDIGEIKIPRYVFFSDSLHIRDTEYVYVEREQRLFSDKDSTYMAWVSGYEPMLDSLVFTERTREIVKTFYPQEKRNKFYLEGRFMYDSSPYLPLTLNYGYSWRWGEAYGGGGYDFYSKSVVLTAGLKINLVTW